MRTRQTVAHAIATHSQMPEGERRKLELRCEEALAAVIALRTHSDQLQHVPTWVNRGIHKRR
jgi:hypothetical protein